MTTGPLEDILLAERQVMFSFLETVSRLKPVSPVPGPG